MTAVDQLLVVGATVWWIFVVWYALRFPFIRRTHQSWNLLLTGLLIAAVLTEETWLVRQVGWAHHDVFLIVALLMATLLGFERIAFLWITRRRSTLALVTAPTQKESTDV